VSRITQIQALVRNGLYYLTEHADDEAMQDEFDIYDIENGILSGRIRKSWPKDGKFEIIGKSLDGREIGVICRLTTGGKVRVITVYQDQVK
jgi:antitoxin component YwqK of YwqJK toxin-antitoxin module